MDNLLILQSKNLKWEELYVLLKVLLLKNEWNLMASIQDLLTKCH
jgi:hypothetical protein